ncbi:MAG: thiamine-phosphate kinase [Pseudomonadota bacterium]|mgnify:CR=1 FL=1
MILSEFDIIRRYFAAAGARRDDVAVGVGDDAAVVDVPPDRQLVLAMDTLVSGVHFPEETRAEDIGHKALAVNLSDLAAMGAEPAWATLALTAPRNDPAWLAAFAEGFSALAREAGVQLIGGDTTRGPLTVTVQVHGFVPRGQAVLRSGARPGDVIYVSGSLGDAGLALRRWQQGWSPISVDEQYLATRLNRPVPRLQEGRALRGLAGAMIDISDGLAADLGHILEASGVGATLQLDALPLSPAFQRVCAAMGETQGARLALGAGDDYELCFTAPAAHREQVERQFAAFGCGCRAIGVIEERPGLRVRQSDGSPLVFEHGGYDHFAAP